MVFGDSKRVQELEAENANLKQWVDYLKGTDALQLVQLIQSQQAELATVQQQVAGVRTELWHAQQQLAQVRAQIVETNEVALLQEVGIYQYRHPLDNAVSYKGQLAQAKDAISTLARDGRAVTATTTWQVNGSTQEGAKMVRDFSKLMLRAYNAEADNAVRTLKPYALQSAVSRLDKTRGTIARLGQTMSIRISDDYHRWRIYELELTADYLVKVEEEKERLREERERQREEEKARREIEAEKARLAKEQSHYLAALEKLRAKGDEAGAGEMAQKLTQIEAAIAGLEAREANIRAGYVYVISNFGTMGEHVVKIGMTRRLEPMDRVRELGDASVPFGFDVHALVFSEDAVGLEGQLHAALAQRRVNLVNMRREFFYATPHEVREALESIGGQQLLEFNEVAEAVEWRASGGIQRTAALTSDQTAPVPVAT